MPQGDLPNYISIGSCLPSCHRLHPPHLLTCCCEGWAMEVAAMAKSTGQISSVGAKGPAEPQPGLYMCILGSRKANSATYRGYLTALARVRLHCVTRLRGKRSPLPRGEGELGNIHYKAFESSLIYDHFAPRELGTSQALCSRQGSVSTALLGEHWSSGCQVLTSFAVHGAITVTDSSENLYFL